MHFLRHFPRLGLVQASGSEPCPLLPDPSLPSSRSRREDPNGG